MKSNRIYLYLLLFVGIFLWQSCSSDDDSSNDVVEEPIESSTYEDGIFVVNEGQFPNEGTITFISSDFENVEQKIFQENNNGMELGNTPQSMFFDGDKAYIITNSSNFVRVVDRYTFEDLGIISGEMTNPRYGVATNGKAYITNGYANHLTVLDLENQTVEKTISLEKAGEFIFLASNGMIYVQQASFGVGNKIGVLDPQVDYIVGEIETFGALNSITLDDNFLYALTNEKLQKFNLSDLEEFDQVLLDYETSPANLILENDELYYTVGKKVYRLAADEFSAPATELFEIESNSYGLFYGFEVRDSHIFIADGGDFVSDSYVEIRDLEGNLIKTITVGVGPNGFYFNNAF